ncbi:hypothetical protein AAG570_012047 [Ranatra chinensis]|uniref:Uncharacterized protein n=1 Tax=Ranatra chinensis TaxID=642074 RepID=A0ABD0YHZ3_9HEMI
MSKKNASFLDSCLLLILPQVLLSVAAIVATAPVARLAVGGHAPVAVKQEDYDAHPQYSYSYEVQDAVTGDSKSQHETRDGDVVQGSYTLIEPDGSRRTVEYAADPVNGFNAVVHKEPAAGPAPVAHAPVATIAAHHPIAAYAHPQPVYASYASPHVSYAI